jgi:hypothetical protein
LDVDGIIIAIVGGAGGIYITIHEFRRREHKSARKEIDELVDEVDSLRHLLLEQRRYIFKVVTYMIDEGMNPPLPPAPSFDPDEYRDHE